MEKNAMKKNLALFLTGLVIFSVGFAVGRHTKIGMTCGEKSCRDDAACTQCPNTSSTNACTSQPRDRLVVYYMHRTVRCPTCNKVESQTKELLEKEFADAMKTGRIEFREMDFTHNQEIAEKYDIGFNMLVLSQLVDGKEVKFERLDEVMALAKTGTQDEFNNYLRAGIQKCLQQKQ